MMMMMKMNWRRGFSSSSSSSYCYNSQCHRIASAGNITYLSTITATNTPNTTTNNINLVSSSNGRIDFDKIKGIDDALFVYRILFTQTTRNQLPVIMSLPDVIQFNKLLSRLSNLKHYTLAISLFNHISCLGGLPAATLRNNICTLSILINCYSNSSHHHCRGVDFGFSILGSIFKRALLPTSATFTPLLKALFRLNRFLEAHQLFNKIVTLRVCKLNIFIFGVVINGLCKSHNTSMAIQLLRLMEQQGTCPPDTHVYNMVIDSLCKDRLVDSALDLFHQMLHQKRIIPDVVTYTSLIHGLSSFSRWKEVEMLWKEMISSNIHPNLITFDALIDALCKQGMVDKAHDVVLNVMIRKYHLVPNLFTYNALMDGYFLQGRVDEAKKIFNSLPGKGIVPDVCSYSTSIHEYFKKMKIDEAMNTVREMPLKRLEPNVATCNNTVLQGLFRVHKCSTALEVLNEMQAADMKPDFHTYCIMLDGLCGNGHVEQALALLDELEKNGLHLHITYYNIVINGLCKDKKLDTAGAPFDDLPSKGLHPDVVTYNTIISGCCRIGLLKEAQDILLKMEQRSCIPNGVTYNIIFRGILRSGGFEEATEFLDMMVARGFSPDGSTADLLCNLLQKKEINPGIVDVIKKCAPKLKADPNT